MVIRDFINYLLRDLGYAGMEIARRSKVSQGWISKVSLGGIHRFPEPDICHRLFGAYRTEWLEFSAANPRAVQEMRKIFDWLYAIPQPAADAPEGLATAIAYLQTIFSSPTHARLITEQLRVQADVLRGDRTKAHRATKAHGQESQRRPRSRSRVPRKSGALPSQNS